MRRLAANRPCTAQHKKDRDLREYCARQHWEIAEVFTERGESARTEDRPEFQGMLAFCKRKRIDFVVVYDLSRFARDTAVQGQALYKLRQCGTQIRSLREPNVDDTAAGKFAGNMIGATNQYVSDALSERMQRSGRESREAGRYPRSAPLGYKNVKPLPGEPNIVPDESAIHIEKAFMLMATGRYTKTEVLRIVNNEGFTNKTGDPVPMQTFVEMLKNPIYIGWQRSRKYDELTKGLWRPIVDEKTFHAVQMIAAGKKPTTTPHARSRPEFPLRITLLCEGCGKPLTGGKPKGRNGKQFSYYWCRTKGCRKVKSIKTSVIDAQFVKLLQRLKGNPDFVAKFLPLYEQALRASEEDSKAEIRALDAEIEHKQKLRKELNRRWLEGELNNADYREMKAGFDDEIEGLEEREGYVSMPQTIRELQWLVHRDSLLDVSQGWERGTVAQRQMFQKILFPSGLRVTSTGQLFEPDKDILFSHLESLTNNFINLASPAGFEPALPP
jgi:site-specific DNA recombinase